MSEMSELNKEIFFKELESGIITNMICESTVIKKTKNFNCPESCYRYFHLLHKEKDDIETMWAAFLNSQNELLKLEKLSEGSINSSAVYPREIVKKMLKYKAIGLVLSHNHPSNSLHPSFSDKHITFRLACSLETIGCTLHDHIICTDMGFYSFANEGKIKSYKSIYENMITKKDL